MINHLQNVQAAIDETVPDAIPTEVIADWKDQDFGRYFGGDTDYTDTVTAIAGKLPAEYAEKLIPKKPGFQERSSTF